MLTVFIVAYSLLQRIEKVYTPLLTQSRRYTVNPIKILWGELKRAAHRTCPDHLTELQRRMAKYSEVKMCQTDQT